MHNKHTSPYVSSVVASIVAAVVFLAVLLSGVDIFQFFGWAISVGTLAPLILFALTSIAVIVFFRRNPQLGVSMWASLISPALAFIALGGLALTALLNFSSLSAADPAINLALQLLPVAVFVVGVVVALIAKRVSPERYGELLEHGVADAREE